MIAAGEVVEARGETWVVVAAHDHGQCARLTLEGLGAERRRRITLVTPFDRPLVIGSHRLRRASPACVRHRARRLMASARPADGLWVAAEARIDLLPYQLEPALAVLGGATRILLADAVGLGKTIQAGLILAELRARGLVDRALVVTPAGLRHAWVQELAERFGLKATPIDQLSITAQSWVAGAGVNPWLSHSLLVASIDFVKRPDVLASVEQAPFDLLIVDEAHHLTPGTDRGAAIARLAARTPWVVLATATPHSGDEAAFTSLTKVGAHRDALTVFRRTRRDVGLAHARRVNLLAVAPTSDERTMLDAVERYTQALWRGCGQDDAAVRLIAVTLRRRAASSAAALLGTVRRRRALLASQAQPQERQGLLPWEDIDAGDGDHDDALLSIRGLNDPIDERRQLDDLAALASRATACASKFRRVDRLLQRVREPLVVFTEYRDTLDALAEALTPSSAIALIHGAMPIEARCASIERFTSGDAVVLLATDAAGEGLNLQQRCRLVVNIELPWNPLRLEQRIGRVDRIGQSRRVHAIHLLHAGTIEDTVLARLERRRVRAARTLNDLLEWWSERDMASAVFDGVEPDIGRPPAVATCQIDRAAQEAVRLDAQRSPELGEQANHIGRPLWAQPPGLPRASVALLFATREADANGLALAHSAIVVRVDLEQPVERVDWRTVVGRLRNLDVVHRRVRDAAERRRPQIDAALRPLRTAMLQRLAAIRKEIAESHRRQLQPSLFDRKVEHADTQRRAVLARLDEHLAQKVIALARRVPEAAMFHARLVAAWPLRDRP